MGALTLVVAAAPSVLLLTYFYLRDRFEREPLGHLALAYALGIYAMLSAHGLTSLAEDAFTPDWLQRGGELAKIFDAFVLSGLLEELSKGVLLIVAIYHWRELDEPLDGVIYGVALSLGFATLENALYLTRLGLGAAWARAVFAVPAHALFGGAMGYYAGRLKFAPRPSPGATTPPRRARWKDAVLCLTVPTAFHGCYDYALLHLLDWKVWIAITVVSAALWRFVLLRTGHAERSSPYRPKTMPPAKFRAPRG